MKRVIWSNFDFDVEDWREPYREFVETNCIDQPETDENILDYAYEENEMYFDDERMNLDVPLFGRVLVIGDIGRWNGRCDGYRILGSNLNSILDARSCDYTEFYDDGYNIKCRECHHDGTNHYEFRLIREDRNIDCLLEAIVSHKATRAMINRYTKSLHGIVSDLYGWRPIRKNNDIDEERIAGE